MNSSLLLTLRKGASQSMRKSLLQKSIIIPKNTTVFVNNNEIIARSLSSLPYHIVVGMPALSPTMEAGTISSWKVGEGDSFAAGDALAEIETDKASIDFEAQDDGVVAKILVDAGSSEITVGVPIMVTVEEEDDVAAFKDFVAPEAEAAAEPEPVVEAPVVEEVTPEPVVAAAPTPTPAPTPVVTPEPEPVVAVAPAVPETAAAADVSVVSPGWGNFAKVKSPLASTLSASQKKYIELYGSTGQVPL